MGVSSVPKITVLAMLAASISPIFIVFLFLLFRDINGLNSHLTIIYALGLFIIYMAVGSSYLLRKDVVAPVRLVYASVWITVSMPVIFTLPYSALGFQQECISGVSDPWDILYFSYVSFTTLGYGDLKPLGICRAVAAFQAVVGYLSLGGFVGASIAFLSPR